MLTLASFKFEEIENILYAINNIIHIKNQVYSVIVWVAVLAIHARQG